VVILKNRYIHLHAVSRSAGTNCTHKPGTIETVQSTLTLNALFCNSIKSQQLAYRFDFQFISSFRSIGMINVYLHHTCDNILHNISMLSEWRSRISVCGLFSAIAVPYRDSSAVSFDNTYILQLYLCVVILKNRNIYLHAVSRLVGTNCPRKWRFDLNKSTAKFDNRTLHRNTPYPSVKVTVDIKFTSVLQP